MKTLFGRGFLNVGTGEDITIGDFARLVAEVVGFKGELKFDISRPDGPPQKAARCVAADGAGLEVKNRVKQGLAAAYADFLGGGGRRRN